MDCRGRDKTVDEYIEPYVGDSLREPRPVRTEISMFSIGYNKLSIVTLNMRLVDPSLQMYRIRGAWGDSREKKELLLTHRRRNSDRRRQVSCHF